MDPTVLLGEPFDGCGDYNGGERGVRGGGGAGPDHGGGGGGEADDHRCGQHQRDAGRD
jgi:hypothetical protein